MLLADFRRGDPLERVLGTYPGREAGPLLVVTAGVHGNEPAGIVACRRVLRELAARRPRLSGRFVALSGNRAALARDVRSIDHDLNRLWTREEIARTRSLAGTARNEEQRELADLAEVLEREFARAPGPVTLLDLHSTSGDGPPFTLLAHPRNGLDLARAIDVPALLGLERILGSTLIDWAHRLGHRAIVLEGGQNAAESTADHHESALWVALVACGLLAESEAPELASHRARLARAAGALPRVLEIGHRHELQPGERFEMTPGWANFDAVKEGDLVARSGSHLEHEVCAPMTATMIMPRYQGQGLDGYFLACAVAG
ncbi:MAG: succinylglutamate desuccinylase/aspartoacylase family protein [Planctomycetes bacterium]|nr:succinylglutamate desuccinylase/aspartoacylase family protein [Planctomycetota bacterium]